MILLALLLMGGPALAESSYKLVWFRTDWCPWSAKMKPSVEKFTAEHRVESVQVNLDQTDSPAYRQYSKYNPRLAVPYLVLLDSKGKVVRSWDRYVTLEDLESALP